MLKNSFNKKILSGLLVTAIIMMNFSFITIPQRARANGETVVQPVPAVGAFPVSDTVAAQNHAEAFIVQVGDKIARNIAKVFILTIAQQTADWIATGFQGNPSFLNDPERFAKSTTDQAIGDFIYNDPSLSFLCKPFQLQVKLSLALQHRPYYQTVDCTLTGVINNVTHAITDPYTAFKNGDFIGGGGWDSFLVMTTDPNATPEGAFLTMSSELDARIQNKQGALTKELQQGSGSLSFRNCTETSYAVTKNADGTIEKQAIGADRNFTGNPFYDQSGTTRLYTSGGDSAVNNYNNTFGTSDTYEGTDKVTTCKVTTPGALIASNLFSTSQSGQKISEMQAVIGDAMDIIIGGVSTLVVSTAMTKIKEAFSSNTQNYASLDQMTADLQAQQAAYNASVSASGSYYNQNGTINQNYNPSYSTDPLSTQRANANTAINNQIGYENVYKSNQQNIYDYLSSVKNAFTSAIACNNTYSSSEQIGLASARISSIQTNVLGAINGNTNPSNGAFLFTLNTISVSNSITTANTNVSTLNARLQTVASATTEAGINSQLNGLGNSPFHSSTQAVDTSSATSIYNQALIWKSSYDTNLCKTTIPTFSN